MGNKPVWPFGDIMVDDFGEAAPETRRFVTMDAGKPKVRSFSSVAPTKLQGSLWMTLGEWDRFKKWYRDTLLRGTSLFLMPDQLYDGMPLLAPDGTPFLFPDGTVIMNRQWWLLMFGEDPYRLTEKQGSYLRVALNLMRFER